MIDTAVSKHLYVAIQGKKAENIAVTFNSLLASAGGTWLNNADAAKNATVALQQVPTSAALGVLAKLAKSPAADPELNTADESGSNTPFTNGKAGYQVNYPFVYKGAEPELQAKIGFARFPRVYGERQSAPPLGGFNMGVGKFSKHKDLAFQVAACMRQPSNQLFATDQGGVPPTLKALYPKLDRKTYPFADELESSINDAAARPVSPAYNDLSLAVQDVTSPFSAISPQKDAKQLRSLSAEALKSEAVL
jgi:multiple sugar transport system substrate-binding protein